MRCHCPRTHTTVPREVPGRVRTCKTGESRSSNSSKSRRNRRSTRSNARCRWMVRSSWCRGCQIYLLNPVQDKSRTRVDGTCNVQKLVSPLRSVQGSSARHTPLERKESWHRLWLPSFVAEKMCCRSCVSNVGTVQLDAWVRQLLTGRVRQTTQVRS